MDNKHRLEQLRKKAAPVVTLIEHGLWLDCYDDWVSAVSAVTGDDESAREAIRAAKELIGAGLEPPVDDPTDGDKSLGPASIG